jgi:hypothetical protein
VTNERDLLTPALVALSLLCVFKGLILLILSLTRMLSGKFFAIASAILAAAVNASSVEVVKRSGPVRSPCIAHLVSCGRVANEVQTLTALLA